MTQRAYPLDNIEYTAEDVQLFHAARTPGIFNATGKDLQVKATGGLGLSISPGVAFLLTGTDALGGFTYANKAVEIMNASTPGSTRRYDYISVRYTKADNTALLTYVVGTGSTPTPVRNTSIYEIIIAIIDIPANASQITQSNINDVRLNPKYCGLVVDGTDRVPVEGLQAQFETFMQTLQASLSGNVAGNLLNLINNVDTHTLKCIIDKKEPSAVDIPEGYFYFQVEE